MSFDAYAVATRRGPHVTLQAGVVHLGRHWTTTTRRSLKAAVIARTGRAAATVGAPGGGRLLVAGPARVLDLGRPWTTLGGPAPRALAGAVDAALVGGALARMAGGQLEQVLGYLEAGRGVPGWWLPWGRVVLVTDVRHRVALDHPQPLGPPGGEEATGPPPVGWLGDVPAAVAAIAGRAGPCHLGVGALGAAVALPATWDPVGARAVVARAALDAVGADLPGEVCVTLDDSTSRRPDRKRGLILRGRADATDVDGATVAVAVGPGRASWWDGFRSGTTAPGAR